MFNFIDIFDIKVTLLILYQKIIVIFQGYNTGIELLKSFNTLMMPYCYKVQKYLNLDFLEKKKKNSRKLNYTESYNMICHCVTGGI